jgi:hypothetical protein
MSLKGVEKTPSGAEYRKKEDLRRSLNLKKVKKSWICRNILNKNVLRSRLVIKAKLQLQHQL